MIKRTLHKSIVTSMVIRLFKANLAPLPKHVLRVRYHGRQNFGYNAQWGPSVLFLQTTIKAPSNVHGGEERENYVVTTPWSQLRTFGVMKDTSSPMGWSDTAQTIQT